MSDRYVVRVTIGGDRVELTGYRAAPTVIEIKPSDCVRTVTRADGTAQVVPDPEGLQATIARQVNAAFGRDERGERLR